MDIGADRCKEGQWKPFTKEERMFVLQIYYLGVLLQPFESKADSKALTYLRALVCYTVHGRSVIWRWMATLMTHVNSNQLQGAALGRQRWLSCCHRCYYKCVQEGYQSTSPEPFQSIFVSMHSFCECHRCQFYTGGISFSHSTVECSLSLITECDF